MITLHTGSDQGLTIQCNEDGKAIDLENYSSFKIYLKQKPGITITTWEGEKKSDGQIYKAISTDDCKDLKGDFLIEVRGITINDKKIHLGDDTITFTPVIKIP